MRQNVRLLVLLVLLVIGIFTSFSSVSGGDNVLRVSFLDVGQGDAVFIESGEGVQILIDGGPNASVLRGLADEMGFFDRTIDVVVATHPDKDHIGGLVDVLQRYEVGTILITNNKSDSAVSKAFFDMVEKEGANIVYARGGTVVDFVGGQFEVLFPDRDVEEIESNTSSIIARLTYGERSFMFTGDSPQSIEKYISMRYGDSLPSDVLKIGHHGSRTSSSELFLATVHPTYGVISAGADNQYGHPHKDVTDALLTAGIQMLSTASLGTITFETDGVFLRVR